MTVVNLKLASKQDGHNETLEKYDSMNKEFREWLVANPNSGFCMVGYCRDTKGGMSSIANYRLADPMDAYVLPEFVKGRLEDVRKDAQS